MGVAAALVLVVVMVVTAGVAQLRGAVAAGLSSLLLSLLLGCPNCSLIECWLLAPIVIGSRRAVAIHVGERMKRLIVVGCCVDCLVFGTEHRPLTVVRAAK